MTTTVLAMVTINEDEPQALARYLEVTGRLMKRANANIVQRFQVNEVVIGEASKTIIIVEYPNRDAINLVFQSEEYKALKPTRDKAFSSYDISVVSDTGANIS